MDCALACSADSPKNIATEMINHVVTTIDFITFPFALLFEIQCMNFNFMRISITKLTIFPATGTNYTVFVTVFCNYA